ncbi:hypothetical protein AB1Y20_011483 [Prymnesium parvum]|uniref:Uncharacterized protein n=1 Tax=Prymnesium parvum TaxID=97485 RepID=A0AB34IK52_PRYPA
MLSLAAPNATRWLGLHKQAMRNRELRPNICEALCGKAAGVDDESEAAGSADADVSSDEEWGSASSCG